MARRRRLVREWTPDEITRSGRRPSQELSDASDEAPFVQIAKAAVGVIFDAIQRIGSATIGPDQTGNARGQNAFDLQASREFVTQVAGGEESIAVGVNNEASGAQSIAIGKGNLATGGGAVAIGRDSAASGLGGSSLAVGVEAIASGIDAAAVGLGSVASGLRSSGFGFDVEASGVRSTAVGYQALAAIDQTVGIGGVVCVRRSWSATPLDWMIYHSGTEVLVMTHVIDLLVAADFTLSFPSGCKFWIDGLGLICTAVSGLVTQPTVRFGISGNLAKHRAAALTTLLTAAAKRETWAPLVPEDGETSLSFGVTAGAAATTCSGRAYWRGMLVQDEP